MKFTGSFDELKEKVEPIVGSDWHEAEANKKSIRKDKGILNWYPSTGTMQFQGPGSEKEQLESDILAALFPDEFTAIEAVAVEQSMESENGQPASESNDGAPATRSASQHLLDEFNESELIFGIVSAVGTDTERIVRPLSSRLEVFGYNVVEVKVSGLLDSAAPGPESEYGRITRLMKAGDALRSESEDNAVLALGAAKEILSQRDATEAKSAYIINSLKHPDEVDMLRKIYGQGFYLLGIHADSKRRVRFLKDDRGLNAKQAGEVIGIDEDEDIAHGQRTRDTFHKSDFFVSLGSNDDQLKHGLERFLELIFSHPYRNPTFDEFAMFMAFSSSIRSGDLSRQVGAVLTSSNQIIATGANDCPKFGGGLYWAERNPSTGQIEDAPSGKDYMRGEDSNKAEKNEIVDCIVEKVQSLEGVDNALADQVREIVSQSRIRDLTEFGRIVHAEMETLLSCARSGVETQGATLYCTTFPCHNCAKHIVAAGVKRVVYVEPYPKSKALDFHADSIWLKEELESEAPDGKVVFEPFAGIGARRFLDLFSMTLGAGSKLKRKDENGQRLEWDRESARLRVPMLPCSYRDLEGKAQECFDACKEKVAEAKAQGGS